MSEARTYWRGPPGKEGGRKRAHDGLWLVSCMRESAEGEETGLCTRLIHFIFSPCQPLPPAQHPHAAQASFSGILGFVLQPL